LAKKYSGDESGKFVNGILGGLVRSKKWNRNFLK
jgi:transcription termination factor NusB